MPVLSRPRRKRFQTIDRRSGSVRDRQSFAQQIGRHSVALISLVVAIVSLGYNTWRNETSEIHRNWREAAFQITIETNQLKQFVLYRRYFHDRQDHALAAAQDADTWIGGWAKATSIRDLTSILPDPLPLHGQAVFEAWQSNAADLDGGGDAAETAEDRIVTALNENKDAVLELIDDMR